MSRRTRRQPLNIVTSEGADGRVFVDTETARLESLDTVDRSMLVASPAQIKALVIRTLEAQQRNAERLVRERAYFLWEDAGYPEGRDLEFWYEAERMFRGWTHQLTGRQAEELAGAAI